MLNNPNEWHNIEENNGDKLRGVPGEQLVDSGGAKPLVILVLILVLVLLIGTVVLFINGNKYSASNALDFQQENSSDMQTSEENQFDENETAVISVNLDENNQENTVANNKVENNSRDMNHEEQAYSAGNNNKGDNDLVVQQMPLNTTTIEKRKNDMVLVSIGGSGRENPFVPSINVAGAGAGASLPAVSPVGAKIPFEIIEPPSGLYLDTKAQDMMLTTVSGIMFDNKNPSAIINMQGQDQLVRKGDIISGYTILDITKDKVVVKQSSNIYRASVGQTIGTEGVNINEVYNLKNRFGGTYTKTTPNSIEIKAN